MGQLLIYKFSEQIANIKTEKIRQFTCDVLMRCSDDNARKPASSTGKYHPRYDLGENGLIRHSQMVAYLADVMCRTCDAFDNNVVARDVVYASALIHDMKKYEDGAAHTNNAHPIALSALIREMNVNNDADFEAMAQCVETHSGKFSELRYPYNGVREMPRPKTIRQYIVAFADMISAQKELFPMMCEFDQQVNEELNESTQC